MAMLLGARSIGVSLVAHMDKLIRDCRGGDDAEICDDKRDVGRVCEIPQDRSADLSLS